MMCSVSHQRHLWPVPLALQQQLPLTSCHSMTCKVHSHPLIAGPAHCCSACWCAVCVLWLCSVAVSRVALICSVAATCPGVARACVHTQPAGVCWESMAVCLEGEYTALSCSARASVRHLQTDSMLRLLLPGVNEAPAGLKGLGCFLLESLPWRACHVAWPPCVVGLADFSWSGIVQRVTGFVPQVCAPGVCMP